MAHTGLHAQFDILTIGHINRHGVLFRSNLHKMRSIHEPLKEKRINQFASCQVWVRPIKEKPTYPRTRSLFPSLVMAHLYVFPFLGSVIVPPENSFPFFVMPRIISSPNKGWFLRSSLHCTHLSFSGLMRSLLIFP